MITLDDATDLAERLELLGTMPLTPESYRTVREALGITAGELAEVMEVSRETILRRERGQTAITREAWKALKQTWIDAVTEEILREKMGEN